MNAEPSGAAGGCTGGGGVVSDRVTDPGTDGSKTLSSAASGDIASTSRFSLPLTLIFLSK